MNCEDCVYSDIADWEQSEKTGKAEAVYWCERYKKLCNDIQKCQIEDNGEKQGINIEDIELVIKIPKSYYELVIERCKDPVLLNAFKNGTPLPKGHGRLFDEKDIVLGNPEIIGNRIYEIEPILEADKAESEDEE